MATNPNTGGPLTGQAAALAGVPLADTPRGGLENSYDGSSGVGAVAAPPMPQQQERLGSWMEDDGPTIWKRADELIRRQELLALNHLAQDIHYTRVKLGCPFSTLEKDEGRDTYKSTLPKGMKATSIQAVPNMAWDLVNKATETVMVDPAEADPIPLNASEESENAAEMAARFLTEDGGENGTNDLALFYAAVDKGMTCATGYIEGWVDPVGGGSVPLQVLAHPQAVSPDNPMIGPPTTDPLTGVVSPGMPTPNPVLRYVTAPVGGQFTDEPSQAAPQWQPKIRASVWGREHWRIFPESQTVQFAEKAIGLLYCTLGEAKRRWPTVAQMAPTGLSQLVNWTPVRYLVLLPPFQRARWKVSAGSDREKAGSSDERIMFYYRILQRSAPDHRKGAEIIVTGANGGMILDRKLLAATLKVPGSDGTGAKSETRCLDLPLVQVTPRADPDERDPTGRCYMELFAGATEFDAALATGYLQALNQWLNPESYMSSTSPVQDYQIEDSRMSGAPIPITRPEDKPVYGNMPPIPPNFWQAMDWSERKVRSIASLDKSVTGSDDSPEVSGTARKIGVQQAMIGLSRMVHPVNAAKARWSRIKIEMAMRDYTTTQTIRYEGEDGSYKATDWTGVDFALVGDVAIKAGTGTMMPPEQKVQYIQQLAAGGMLPPDEAADAARPSFARRLGLSESPHEQYIERCIDLWLKGMPEGWDQTWQAYQQQMQAYQASVAPVQQQYQQAAAHAQNIGVQGPPQPVLPPPPQQPWTPFVPKPNDTEPAIALLWVRKLSLVMSTVKYDQQPAIWRQPFDEKYSAARNIAAQAAQPAPQQQPQQKPPNGAKPQNGQPPQAQQPKPPAPAAAPERMGV